MNDVYWYYVFDKGQTGPKLSLSTQRRQGQTLAAAFTSLISAWVKIVLLRRLLSVKSEWFKTKVSAVHMRLYSEEPTCPELDDCTATTLMGFGEGASGGASVRGSAGGRRVVRVVLDTSSSDDCRRNRPTTQRQIHLNILITLEWRAPHGACVFLNDCTVLFVIFHFVQYYM